uniref:Uncharacterized protein n=1 Tax=Klebsiella pneumoniae TaxID=573 RepID=A0A8B0SUD6_KLEPN|nr:hypothetical protein [Klebsiella pneumoniae]
MITYLAVLIIFLLQEIHTSKRKVFICCLYSEESKESNLNNKKIGYMKASSFENTASFAQK